MEYIVEGRDYMGYWSRDNVEAVGGSAVFSTEAEAQAAIELLARLCNWDRDEMRVRLAA
jgi:hypothetical protein